MNKKVPITKLNNEKHKCQSKSTSELDNQQQSDLDKPRCKLRILKLQKKQGLKLDKPRNEISNKKNKES